MCIKNKKNKKMEKNQFRSEKSIVDGSGDSFLN